MTKYLLLPLHMKLRIALNGNRSLCHLCVVVFGGALVCVWGAAVLGYGGLTVCDQ